MSSTSQTYLPTTATYWCRTSNCTKSGYQKADNESLKDREFQTTLLKLISNPKAAASRAKSVPRPGIKAEGSSKRRATSVRIARSSRHDIEDEPRETEPLLAAPEDDIVKADNSRETDREDGQIKWTEVMHGRKKQDYKNTGTKKDRD